MSIGIIDEKLDGSIGTFLWRRDKRHSQFGNPLCGDVAIVNQECEMVTTRIIACSSPRSARPFKLQNRVNQCWPGLIPFTGERKSGAFDLFHSEHINIESVR